MPTFSIRCKHQACRHRRVSRTHPDDYKVVPKCPACGNRKGWRIEQRGYNKRGLCKCDGPMGRDGEPFPHRTTHPSCEQHLYGIYNQARARGVAHEDIPERFHPMKTIDSFQGEYRFLSNFWPAPVDLDGVTYPSVEHAYVAAKTLDLIARRDIPNMAAGAAKRYGRKLRIRSDWDDVKIAVMAGLLVQKFKHPELAEKLRATGSAKLVEGNTWGDTFWGVCNGLGKNNLGEMLMAVRSGL